MGWLHAVVDVPADAHEQVGDFWSRVSGWPLGAPWPAHPELRSFEPPSGSAYLHLQRISGPGRVHVDVESDAPSAMVDHALGLGARLVADRGDWSTLASPGGLPFCVVRANDRESVPEPITLPDGHRMRLVQVCIDSPRAAHDAEVGFWRALFGGRWSASDRAEFAGKWHDDAGSPVQLLFQRLDEPDGPVQAHLDLGTDDLPAEVARLVALGATDVRPGRGWHVLRDVGGREFCVTLNSPEAVRHRDLG